MNTLEILQGIRDWTSNLFARKDGFYETMGVGTAVNLAGQLERTNDSMYRKSGGTEDIATGTARIENIKGNTVAWNQLLKSDSTKPEIYGITRTKINDGVMHYSGTSTQSKTYTGSSTILAIIGHKYLARCQKVPEGCSFRGGGISAQNNKNTLIFSASSSYYINLGIYIPEDVSVNDDVSFMLFDLTLIYGEEVATSMAANQEWGISKFEDDYKQWFGKPLTYEPYDEGSLRSVMLDGLKTTGFNQWDEEWETGQYSIVVGNKINDGVSSIRAKNKIRVLPDTSYYFQCNSRTSGNIGICWYDLSGNFISGNATTSSSFTSPANAAYLTFFVSTWYGSVYKNDICINLHWSGVKDGTYEPYEEHILPLNVTTLTGRLNGEGESVTIFPDGMKGVNDVHDEIYYVGNKVYGVKRVGSVDLGSFDWDSISSPEAHVFRIDTAQFTYAPKHVNGNGVKGNILCGIYINKAYTPLTKNDNTYFGISDSAAHKMSFINHSYSTASSFKTAMSGVKLYYELATPLVYELEDFTLPARYQVNADGTEEQIQVSGANGIAAILTCIYGVDAVGILNDLPQNYIGEKSMDNLLSQLGAVTGGTWTKTWNENTEEWDFTFTPNAQTNSLTDNQESI